MRARTRNKASLPSSDFPRAEERPMSSATCLRACMNPKIGPAEEAAESLNAQARPGSDVGNGAVFDLAVFAERLAKEDGGRGGAVGDFRDVHVLRIYNNACKVNTHLAFYMTTFSSTINANSFQANDLLE